MKEQIIDTIVNFWINESFINPKLQNTGNINDILLINIVEHIREAGITPIQIVTFSTELKKTLMEDENFWRSFFENGCLLDVDYDVPKLFNKALELSGINEKLLPRKTWICYDKHNKLGNDEVLDFYIRASSGYRGEQYYLTPLVNEK